MPSFKEDIAPLFTAGQIACMAGKEVHLNNYDWMSVPENAAKVLNHLTGDSPPRMPLGGPYWSEEKIALFRSWINGPPPFNP